MEQTYFKIHPQVLRIDSTIPFDVYIRNIDGEYAQFHSKDTAYTAHFHNFIFINSLSELFVKKSDANNYFFYLENIFSEVLNDPFIGNKEKAFIAHGTITTIAMNLFQNVNAATALRYKKAIKPITEFVLKNDDSVKHLIMLTSNQYHEYNHPVNVGIFGMGLAKEMLNPEEHNLTEVFTGFFLHDIGKYTIPKEIYQKNSPLTEQEWVIMKKHPQFGYDLLKKYNLLTPESEVIVLQHHERHNGTGYPAGLNRDQIHTYSKICSIADAFDALSAYRPFRDAQSSYRALEIMREEMKNEFDNEFFKKFVLLFRNQGLD
ncbi:MAG: HD domain-containing protein [Candidatus Latescibacteria bacterium]|nr:HD domain-containing protein [Candidatus Latescibacterota bacterium]